VAEDHQTHNALSLVKRGAACLIPDAEAESVLPAKVVELLDNDSVRKLMSEKIHDLAEFHSAERIAREVLSIIKTN
jgi:UDP-N-acetylglucosamine--N-acetylmuramyl-(pentapeptide) pyrophosphoryl-undecaprenol N-acetylglucosamine transferase